MQRLVLASLLVVGCAAPGSGGDVPDAGQAPVNPAPELGPLDKSAGPGVTFTPIATSTNRIREARDLAFNPLRPKELWVANRQDDSMVIITDAPDDTRTFLRRKDGYALHFMEETSSMAFGGDETTIGKPGTFATCGESRNTYNHQVPEHEANDFMGPALWSSDLSVFAMSNPNGLGSHLDMLHHSPLCMGIAHEKDNAYWVIGGLDGAVFRYDFGIDDGIGNDDHSDGRTKRFLAGQLAYVENVPSHLQYRHEDQFVYFADTGNARIAKLDTTSGVRGDNLPRLEPVREAYDVEDAVSVDVVPESSGLLQAPSGLELFKDRLFVSDNATGKIHAFSLDGTLLNTIDTGLGEGALAGMAFGPDEKLYFVDMKNDQVLRIDP